MTETEDPTISPQTRPARHQFDGQVTVELPSGSQIVGPGQNISSEGVFFIADATISVKVRIDGEDELVDGEIVRLESMGGGRLGVAVRFAPTE